MAIASVDTIPVRMDVTPLEEGGLAPYVSNHASVESVDRVLVRVETEDGGVGWGELLATLGSTTATMSIIDQVIAPELVGREPENIREFIEQFYFPYVKIEPYLGAVEMALWDLVGKRFGAPISDLFGGTTSDRVSVAYCLGILTPEQSADRAAAALEQGYETLKTKAGHDWQADVDRLQAMHDAVDGKLEFRLDPNQGWSVEDAVRAVASLEDAGIFLQYIEQPVSIDQYGTYHQLRSRLRTPIGVNEDTYFRRNLYHLASRDAIDVAVADLVPAGGFLRLRELAGVAADAGISMSHHCGFDLGIKTAAMLHAVGSTPAINLAPDTVYYAWADDILETNLEIHDGSMPVPDGPGLGVSVDEAAIETYRTDGG